MVEQQELPGTAKTPPSPLAHQLFEDWNHWRKQTRQFAVFMQKHGSANWTLKGFKATPERLYLLDDMVLWCRERGLEPRLWLMCLFKIRKWTFSPQLTPGSLMSEDMIPKAKRERGLGILRSRVQQTNRAARGDDIDPNRDLVYSVEALKARYFTEGAHARCLDEILERTLGYHEKSVTCRRCPLAAQCSLNLVSFVSFDILGLRAGRITAQQAEEQARTAHARS